MLVTGAAVQNQTPKDLITKYNSPAFSADLSELELLELDLSELDPRASCS